MEPQLPQVNVAPETQPIQPDMGSVESDSISVEKVTQTPEIGRNGEMANTDLTGQVAAPVIMSSSVQPADDSRDDAATDDNPVVASDSNVIEKEWIDKVKQVVSSTKDNPYEQQNKVSKLMADYVLKRYGRKIGESSD